MEFDLVFEGGGAKGMVFVGALAEFYQRGHTVGRIMGTSAGAITAALTAAGYTTAEMLAALNEKGPDGKSVFTSFMAPPGNFSDDLIEHGAFSQFFHNFDIPLIPDLVEEQVEKMVLKFFAEKKPASNLFSLVERGGWYSADNFLTWMQQKMDQGTFEGKPRRFSGMTLAQFRAQTGKDLTLIAADTTSELMLVLNHRTAPDCPVVWAVRMSMSIPLLWQEVIWQPEWGTYRGKDISGDAIVDGGLLSNFPIELFISHDAPITDVMGEKRHENVLGFLIDEKMTVPGAEADAQKEKSGIDVGELKTVKRLSGLVSTVMGARDKAVISAFEDRIVRLPAKGYGTVEFDMSDQRRGLLVEAGRQRMQGYFKNLEEPLPARPSVTSTLPPKIMADRMAKRVLMGE
jgi:predicted acylesterase/phospholipase RssA